MWLAVNPHADVHLHEHPEYINVPDSLHISGFPKRSVLHCLQKILRNCWELTVLGKFPCHQHDGKQQPRIMKSLPLLLGLTIILKELSA